MSIHAVLEWQNGLPYSTHFKDTYFSVSPENPQHGLAETRHVFLQHNDLAARWQALPRDAASHFTIVETGFGSGLNFLATLALWQKTAPPHAHLHFFSVEIAPFSAEDLQRAHAHFPELSTFAADLQQQYKLLQPGINQLELPQYATSLTLYVGDAAQGLPQLQCPVDAWFLDGFAPTKNPEMWQAYLFENMARCARSGTTFATFTSAGFVRRGLQAAGFVVRKVPGYGAKREMLTGCWLVPDTAGQAARPQPSLPSVAIIGAGIAGCSTAWFLAQLGCKVQLFERASTVASAASGNPRGMLYPRLNAEKPLNDQLALRSFSFSVRHYASLALQAADFQSCGVLQLGGSPRELRRVHKVAMRYADSNLLSKVNAEQASVLAGVPIAHESLFFAAGAWVNPKAACEAMLTHPNITLHTAHKVVALQTHKQGWQLDFETQTAHQGFDAVVVCTAADAASLLPDSGMVLHPLRGQMGMVASQPSLQGLKTVLCGDGYLTPASNGVHAMGATFAPGEMDCSVREADNVANLKMLTTLSPQFSDAHQATLTFARAALRCGSPDYLPYVGPVLDPMHLARMEPASDYGELPAGQGLYTHVAHGSKGLMTAPYCAALLARRLLQAHGIALPQLTEDPFWHGLHPQRLYFRQLGWKHLLQPFREAT